MLTNQYGSWIERDGFNYDNPVSRINETHSDVEAREFRLNGMLSFDPIENVRLSVLASTMAYNSQDGYARTLQHAANVNGGEGGVASRGMGSTTEDMIGLTATYDNFIGANDFNILSGYS